MKLFSKRDLNDRSTKKSLPKSDEALNSGDAVGEKA